MKKLPLIIGLIFLCLPTLFGQLKNVKQIIKKVDKIKSVRDAEHFLVKDTAVDGYIMTVNPVTDTSEFYKLILSKNIGELFDFASDDNKFHYVIKILAWEEVNQFRVNYIYLDNNKYSKVQIDSLRIVISDRLANREEFTHLAQIYSMDGASKNGGDIGWFLEGQMVKVFEDSIKAHLKDEVYFVDVPENKWYYVVKNTYNPIRKKVIKTMVIKIEK